MFSLFSICVCPNSEVLFHASVPTTVRFTNYIPYFSTQVFFISEPCSDHGDRHPAGHLRQRAGGVPLSPGGALPLHRGQPPGLATVMHLFPV